MFLTTSLPWEQRKGWGRGLDWSLDWAGKLWVSFSPGVSFDFLPSPPPAHRSSLFSSASHSASSCHLSSHSKPWAAGSPTSMNSLLRNWRSLSRTTWGPLKTVRKTSTSQWTPSVQSCRNPASPSPWQGWPKWVDGWAQCFWDLGGRRIWRWAPAVFLGPGCARHHLV